jgi:hypothetical protein
MYHTPKHFAIEEVFPPETVQDSLENGIVKEDIWRIMDLRILLTLDRLRERFGTTVVNDYLWGGSNTYRGFRPSNSLVDLDYLRRYREFKASWSSFTSQHCFGRAIDCKFKNVSAEEVRADIKADPFNPTYEYITAIEENTSWLHFDVRSWNKQESGILFFYA